MRPTYPAAVLWDMDGTLIDSEPFWLLSEAKLASDYGSTWTESNGHELIGKSLYDSSAILRERFSIEDLSVEQVIERLTDEVVSHLKGALPWRPGALELLMDLKSHGVKTALVTMSMRRMALAVVEQIPFLAFDEVVAGDDVRFGKPHPEPYLTAAARLGVDIQQCIALEDSTTGLASAQASGALAVGVPNIVNIPRAPGRVVIPTLSGMTCEELGKLRPDEQV